MARQCAIVVQRCAQAREGEEEGGVLGQLGKLIIIPGNPQRFFGQKWGSLTPWLWPDGFVGEEVGVTQIGCCDAPGRE